MVIIYDCYPIIQQLKNQVIFNYCRKYVSMGCRVKSIDIPDDFSMIDMDVVMPGVVQMIDIKAGFKV